jgi:hypothetical protein
MFEGFTMGPNDETGLPPPTPPEWWEILIVVWGMASIGLLIVKMIYYV